MFRAITSTDYPAVHSIYMSPQVNPFMSFEVMPYDQFAPIIEQLVKEREYLIWEEAEKIAAVVALVKGRWRGSHRVMITALAVDSQFQGIGVGKRLMQQLLNDLSSQGFIRIELIVESDNPKAIQFYHQLGFVHEGTMQAYFKRENEQTYVDDYLMAKIIVGRYGAEGDVPTDEYKY